MAQSHPLSRDSDPSKSRGCTPVTLLFHPPDIAAPMLHANHFYSPPEVIDSLALLTQQDWEMRAVASPFQAHGHTGAHEGSISPFACPHLHIPEHSNDGVVPALAVACSVVMDWEHTHKPGMVCTGEGSSSRRWASAKRCQGKRWGIHICWQVSGTDSLTSLALEIGPIKKQQTSDLRKQPEALGLQRLLPGACIWGWAVPTSLLPHPLKM